jgi:hypothetical protein
MPVLLVGSAVCSTQRQQVGIDIGDVRDQQHGEEIVAHDERHLKTLVVPVVFQPLVIGFEVRVPKVGLPGEVCGDVTAGRHFKAGDGITGFNDEELSEVGQGFFRRQPKLSYSVGDDVADPGVGQADHVAGVSDDKHGVIPFDWT